MATPTRQRPRRAVKPRAVVDGFVANDLLTFASAISFQILSSLVPLLLFAFGMLGVLSLEHVWRDQLASDIEPTVSRAAFSLLDQTVEQTLRSKQLFWVTAGFLLALWEVSGAVRAVMGVLNRVYGDEAERSWTPRRRHPARQRHLPIRASPDRHQALRPTAPPDLHRCRLRHARLDPRRDLTPPACAACERPRRVRLATVGRNCRIATTDV